MVLLPLNSCEVKEGGDSGRCRGRLGDWAIMALRVLLLITLLILADAQKWPKTGDCRPCVCTDQRTSLGRMRTVNCSRRGLRGIPAGLPDDLMALDLSWNSLDVEQLRQHLCKFQSLQSVSLSFADLTTLSDILKECSSVLELNLTGNRLAQVDSKTFIGLKNLRRLLGLEVESVVNRDVFQHLTSLRDLDILFHGVTLPKGLFDDLVIQSLNLVVTQASSLPQRLFEFGQKTLNTLQLIGEHITQVDENLLDGLSVLKKLYLVMPSAQQLPERFFHSQQMQPGDRRTKVASLQEVEISGIHSLPAMLFSNLVTLETLQLKEIGNFPQLGFLAGAINLRTLLITGSKLTSIPAGWFRQLYSLESLTLSGLELEKLDENAFRGLINLNYMDMSNNNLVQITAKMLLPLNTTLETLILRGNYLTEINKDVLGKLGVLRHLDVGENRLTNVYANSFVGMTYLSSLYLNNNRLTSLPRHLFRNLLQLESLSLSDNYLVEFPKAILQLKRSLMSLDLASNELREVPAFQLCQFAYLEMINIMGNYLHCDCSLLAFHQCQTIPVEGQCNSPLAYKNMYIRDIKVPSSCIKENKAKNEMLKQQTKAYTFLPTQSAVVVRTLHQQSQTARLGLKMTTIKPEAAVRSPVNVQQNLILNQNISSNATKKANLAGSDVSSPRNATIIKKLFTEKLMNQSRNKMSVLVSPRQTVTDKLHGTTKDAALTATVEQTAFQPQSATTDTLQVSQTVSIFSVIQKETLLKRNDSSKLQRQKTGLIAGGLIINRTIQEPSIADKMNGMKLQDVKSDHKQASVHIHKDKTDTDHLEDRIPAMKETRNISLQNTRQNMVGSQQPNIRDVQSTWQFTIGVTESPSTLTVTEFSEKDHFSTSPNNQHQKLDNMKTTVGILTTVKQVPSSTSARTFPHENDNKLLKVAKNPSVGGEGIVMKEEYAMQNPGGSFSGNTFYDLMTEFPHQDPDNVPAIVESMSQPTKDIDKFFRSSELPAQSSQIQGGQSKTLSSSGELSYLFVTESMESQNLSDAERIDSGFITRKTPLNSSTQLPAALDVDEDMELANESYLDPKGENIGNGKENKKANTDPQKMAFNFIISALVALSLSGCVVLGIVFMRRWQQKGSYIISEDTEMNNLSADMETAAVEKPVSV